MRRTRISRLFLRASSVCAEEEGQTLVEYALILLLVSIAAITLLSAVGQFPSSVFDHVNADF